MTTATMTDAELTAIVDGVAELAILTREMGEAIIATRDEYVCAAALMRAYPDIPNSRWIYARAEKLGAVKVGERRVVFSLRAARSLLGPGNSARMVSRPV